MFMCFLEILDDEHKYFYFEQLKNDFCLWISESKT